MASMCFGYKTTNTATGLEFVKKPVITACWAALKWPNPEIVLNEITWVPEQGHSNHIKVLLPLMFPDVKYEEFECTRGGTYSQMHYAVRFTGLENVYRSNFMFRMFVIRNIDRDGSCTKAFEYLLSNGFDPLASAAVAANIDVRVGWNRDSFLSQKGYASCMNGIITVADVKAFARAPHKVKHKQDLKFGEGGGFGYRYHPGLEGLRYDGSMTQNTLAHYQPSRAQFASRKWLDGVQPFLAALFKKGKKVPAILLADDLAVQVSKAKPQV